MSPTPLVDRSVVAGNVYDKYCTRNPIARLLMRGFLRDLEALVARSGATRAHEVGCGEGHLSIFLRRHLAEVRGSDVSERVIAQACTLAEGRRASITFQVADLYAMDPRRDGDELVVCCEVLEHVVDPERALAVLARLAQPHLIVSVPREPLWRILNVARGKYLSEWGNTPGHLQHWSRRAFLDLLARRLEVVEVRTPLPWTMVLCRARRPV